MSHRNNTRSDASQAAPQDDILQLSDDMPPTTKLQQWLSVKTILSTATSSVITQQDAADTADEEPLEEIGLGQCGVVFSLHGTGQVVKRATGIPFFTRQIRPDFEHHIKVYNSHHNLDEVQVPKPFEFVEAEDYLKWQEQHHVAFQGARYREPACLLVSERITPLPKIIRESLVDQFCPEDLREQAKAARENISCLVRLYLGSRLARVGVAREFSLRNFELTLDRMTEIGLDPVPFAQGMGSSLARVHWSARICGRDIEYVLGSIPNRSENTPTSPTDRGTLNSSKRTVDVWLLDFNQCESISLDDAGVEMCVKAFWDNDPYYPRPATDKEHWAVFKSAYLRTSADILPGSPLPQQFITKIENKTTSTLAGPPPQGPPKGPPQVPSVGTSGNRKKGRRYV
ncbi:zinc finger protein-domain-containing protein [Xylariaceae sp. FL1272]|nr:zinc finger protein-domain-containing protein [Xylariaceae sp. FL1272]